VLIPTHSYHSPKEIRNTDVRSECCLHSQALPPAPSAPSWDAAVATAGVRAAAAAVGQAAHTRKGQPTQEVPQLRSSHHNCQSRTTRLESVLGTCTFLEGTARICFLKISPECIISFLCILPKLTGRTTRPGSKPANPKACS